MAAKIRNSSTLCRCCHTTADGDFKSLTVRYMFKKNVEVYSEMLKETFSIDLSTLPVTTSNIICEECVYQVRSARRFKTQVEECERKLKEYTLNELNKNIKTEVSSDDDDTGVIPNTDDHKDLKPVHKEENLTLLEELKCKNEILVNENENVKKTQAKRDKSSKTISTVNKKIVNVKEKQIVRRISQTICVGCKQQFSSSAECKRHMDTCKSVHKCKYCYKNYSSSASFSKHLARHVTQTEFICDYCNKNFKHKNTLLKHVKAHMGLLKRLQCDLCSTKCNDNTQLRIHKSTVHENLRPYACDLCDKKFKSNNHLKIHHRIHTGEKPYHCDICRNSFISLEYLVAHKRNKHNVPGGKKSNNRRINQVCHVCGKTFASKYVLNRHVETSHMNIRKFSCNICAKKFVQKICLTKHMKRLHNPERKTADKVQCTLCKLKVVKLDQHMATHYRRPYACIICLKRYPQKNALNRHLKHVHFLGKPHTCEHCGKTYVKRYSLKMHVEKHHSPVEVKFELV